MNYLDDEHLWAQKYRPRKISDCILPEKIKQTFKEIVSTGKIPSMLLYGTPGSGKTTIALALCNEMDADVLFLNASLESRIDVLRTTIQQFASTVSLTDSTKVVILDEADYSTNSQAFQPALRGMMEQFSSNCSFILTCNNKQKIADPIQSRCTVQVEFKYDKTTAPDLMKQYMVRSVDILNKENVEYEKPVLAAIIKNNFPDFRKILGILQQNSYSGKIDSSALVSVTTNYDELFRLMKDKDLTSVRNWIATNSDIDVNSMLRTFYSLAETKIAKESIPQLILILGDYQFKSSFVVDQEINTAAMLVEIMGTCKFI